MEVNIMAIMGIHRNFILVGDCMSTPQIIIAIITFLMSIICFFISYRQYKEKGFLFNNSYLHATEEERRKMDKKSAYKQSKVVFALVGFAFLTLSLEILTTWVWLLFIVLALICCTIIYAIVSYIKGSK